MQKEEVTGYLKEASHHLVNELLPFWTTRMIDSWNRIGIKHFEMFERN